MGPIIGICLGFEMIVHSFESHLHLSGSRVSGLVTIRSTKNSEVLLGQNNYTVYESHNWEAKKVSKPLLSLASSDYGVELIKHELRPIYGLQFHPEHPSDIDGKKIFFQILSSVSS